MSRITEILSGANGRNDARTALADLNPSKADLAAAARELGIRDTGSTTAIAANLVNGTAGAREDRAAILSANLR